MSLSFSKHHAQNNNTFVDLQRKQRSGASALILVAEMRLENGSGNSAEFERYTYRVSCTEKNRKKKEREEGKKDTRDTRSLVVLVRVVFIVTDYENATARETFRPERLCWLNWFHKERGIGSSMQKIWS